MEKQDDNASSSSSSSVMELDSSSTSKQSILMQEEEEEATIKASLAAPTVIDEADGKEVQLQHYCFLAKHANIRTEVRLTVKDTVGELKSVSSSEIEIKV